jgi:putative FmdB family regulatory protein
MPTYEYACTECGQHLEVVQSMSDAPPTTCSNCGGRLRKVFTPIGVVFKGSGFYRTDSRGKPAKTDADKADKPSKPDSASPKKATEKSA